MPFGWLLPGLGIVGAAAQVFFISLPTLLIGTLLVGAGFAIYAVRERYYLPRQHREIVAAVKANEGPLGRTLKK